MIAIELVHPKATVEMLGYLPQFLSPEDPRSAKEQFDDHYGFAGGFRPSIGWKLLANGAAYPGDPPRPLIAKAMLRDEEIRFYQGAWTAIVQPDGTFEIARLD